MNNTDAVTALAALAQDSRLAIVRLLIQNAPAGLTVGLIGEQLELPAPTLSFHLKELVHADLVSVEREGRNLHYRPALGRMNELLSYLTDHCCMGKSCAPSGAKRRTTC